MLAASVMATALIYTESLPPASSIAPVPTGFMHYGLLAPRSSGPTLPWNPKHGKVLATMDENFNTSLEFHRVTTTKRLGFASSGALLTP